MGVLLPIATGVWAAMTAAAATVAAAVISVVTTIAGVITAILGPIWSVVAGVVVGVIEGIGITSGPALLEILSAVGALDSIAIATYTTVANFIGAVVIGFKGFLEAIHFKTIMAAHEIAYIVSEDYRVMLNGVYESIGKYSAAIGYSTDFFLLALRNARNVVLDVSGMLGRKYDLAEVTWLQELNTYIKKVNEMGEHYADRPYDLLHDLDKWIIKPAADLKGEVVQGIVTTIDSMLDATKAVVEDLVILRDDIDRFVDQLPRELREWAQPRFDALIGGFDEFINTVYGPSMDRLDAIMNVLDEATSKQRKDLGSLIDRLKHPADYLLEIDTLSARLRRQQEDKIADVSSRSFRRNVGVWEPKVNSEMESLAVIMQALFAPIGPPEWFVYEKELPERPVGEKATPRQTWFVGDY